MKKIYITKIRYLVLFCLLITSISFAEDINIDNKNNIYEKFKVSYLKDETSVLTIDDILKKEFIKTANSNFTLGFTKGTAWIKFNVDNKSKIKDFILSINESFYETANLYYIDNLTKQLITKTNGLLTPIEKRDIKINNLAFDIALSQNNKYTFYLELKAKYAYFGNIQLYKKSYFWFDKKFGINTLYIFMFGLTLMTILFNLLLYIAAKEKIYLYYIGFSFFTFVYIFKMSGFLVYFGLQSLIYDLQMSVAFLISFLILFSIEYLEVKKYMPKYYKFLKYITILSFTFGFLILYSYQPWNKVITYFSGLGYITLIITSIIIYFKGNKNAMYYFFAMLLYFIFAIIFTQMVSGNIEYTNITRYGLLVAIAIEISAYSLLLANRYNDIKNNLHIYLEKEVIIRTNKLKVLIDEKEMLLKEIHHRVKNNFHIIIGMIWFENKKIITNKDNKPDLTDLTNRIKSMSMIHESLYSSNDLVNINIKEYLNKIIQNILHSYKNINLKSNLHDITIKFDDAVSLGIIINEIITNSIKHNQKTNDLEIKIEIIKKENIIYLTITDNGIGFLDTNKRGLGLKLIDQFCVKLPNSQQQFSFKNGTKFELKFDEIAKG